jgi:hypothetical protein
MSFRGRPNRTRRALWLCLGLALQGCLASPSVVPANSGPPPPKLDGILSQASTAKAGSIRIFLTHGMGNVGSEQDTDCALASLVAGLAEVLRVSETPPAQVKLICGSIAIPRPQTIAVAGTNLTAELYTLDFQGNDNGRHVRFSYLLWATLTNPIKPTLNEDGHPSWAALTSFSKSFFQTRLSDVVLYGGTYRQVLRAAVEKALCMFVGGKPDAADATRCEGGTADEETVLITHSLGGYMLFDAIADLKAAHAAKEKELRTASPTNAAAKVLTRTQLVFMLANQLALLDLTTLTQWPPPAVTSATGSSGREEPESHGMLMAFQQHWSSYHTTPIPRQIVAISDPNDILSYLVTANDVSASDPGSATVVANVYVGVARDWFGLFALPTDAHLNYLTSPKVRDIIACGMTGDTINPCS